MIRFNCPQCGTGFKTPDEAVGKVIKCRECGEPVKIPWRDAEPLPLPDDVEFIDEEREQDPWAVFGLPPMVVKIGMGFGVVLLLSVIGALQSDKPDRPGATNEVSRQKVDRGDKDTALVMAQGFVKDNLKSPSSAEFGWPSEYSIIQLEENRFSVSGWVDSQNSFGAMLRTNFVCDVEYAGNDEWRLRNLNFIER